MNKPMVISRNRDFQRLYSKGKSFVSPNLVTYVLKNRLGFIRFGVITSKKIGKAVKRNRSRRIIKEAYRSLNIPLDKSFDLVFIARGKTPFVKMQDIVTVMKIHLKNAGVIG